jgi:hypothetical protein
MVAARGRVWTAGANGGLLLLLISELRVHMHHKALQECLWHSKILCASLTGQNNKGENSTRGMRCR